MTEAKLAFWDRSWVLQTDWCPCDVEFVEWLDERKVQDAAIYHFGSGEHHHVGIERAAPSRRDSVISITAAPREHESFVRLAIERPDVLRYYNCVFGDIYLLNDKLLPLFDVVALFHLCEFRSELNDAYGALTDRAVVDLLTGKLKPGGHMLFYTRSDGYERDGPTDTRRLIEAWEREAPVERVDGFKSLLVYRKL